MGHLGHDALNHLQAQTQGITVTDTSYDTNCEVCRVTKAKRIISRRTRERAMTPYKRVHFDLIQMDTGLGSDRWIAHFQCDMTRMNHVYTLTDKRGPTILSCFQDLEQLVRTRWNFQIRIIRTDGERSLGNEFNQWKSAKGITVEKSAPFTPEQNGASERSGGVIIERARSLKASSNLPALLWPEIYRTAAYLLNRSPTRAIKWNTPLGFLQDEAKVKEPKPQLSHLASYGCRSYPLIYNKPKLDRTNPTADIGYLVGYESTNIFRVWIPKHSKVISTRDVTFDETKFYNASYDNPDIPVQEQAVIEVPRVQSQSVEEDEDTIVVDTSHIVPSQDADSYEEESDGRNQLPTPEPTPSVDLQPEEERFREIGLDLDEQNIIQGKRKRVRKQAHATAMITSYGGYQAAFITAQAFKPNRVYCTNLPAPLKFWKDLETYSHKKGFKAAAYREFEALKEKGTFTSIPIHQAKGTQIPLMWVFTYKFDPDGFLLKYKA